MAKILKILLLWSCIISLAAAEDSPKVLNIPLHAARISLDPNGIQDVSSLFVSRQVNCQLVREQGAAYTLEAAESIKYTSPLEVIIKINKNALFHDGSPITANDVIASFNDIKESRSTLRNIFNWVSEMTAVDSRTVKVKLDKPVPQFLKVLAAPNYGIFKASFLHKARSNNKLWKKPLGCGKYFITDHTNSIIKLSPVNEGYQINFHLTQSNQLTPTEAEQYDITDLQIIGNTAYLKDHSIVETYDPTQIYIGLNSNKAPWYNKAARCSFLSKLDTRAIKNKYGSFAKAANDYFPQGVLGYDIKNKYMSKIIDHNHQQPPTQPSFCVAFLTLSIPEKYRS
ncbi:MAG TPA: ABC transporter substrate-binding protein, partial [Gammaproteobacteria bacterium]|nr:ABC transporter substrate-binding protein [Gammaproteobacteria bacterium]